MIEVAKTLAIEAGRRLMALRQTPLVKERKPDHSIVTNADREADQIIREGLHKNFPNHAILTEESGMLGRPDAEYVWVVDPLDGTRAYAQGIQGFSVLIGLLRKGEPYAGVVMDPWEDRLYEAIKGEGAFQEYAGKRKRLWTSKRREWNEMPIVTSKDFPAEIKENLISRLPCPWIVPMNSVGIKVGQVVRQEADLYINHHPVHYWDTAAPQIIQEEAGGVITYTDGNPLVYDLKNQVRHPLPIAATNGQRHTDFLSIIQSIL